MLKRLFLSFFLLSASLSAGENPKTMRTQESAPSIILLSLPACISAVLERPDEAEKLFQPYSYPRNPVLDRLEKEIEKELKAAGEKQTAELRRRRKIQHLISKIEYFYMKANSDPQLMKLFLSLNGLAGDLPARADDNVYELLESRLWAPDPVLKAGAMRRRPETWIRNNNIIRLLIQIQLDMANALYEASGNDPFRKAVAVIEIANIAALPPPEIAYGKPLDLIAGNAAPVYLETSFPILDLYTGLFRLTDWSAY